MRRKNTRYFVVGILAFLLLITGVYAILTTTLNITGSTKGSADFRIEFLNASAVNSDKISYDISTDGLTLTINSNLTYPGDSASVSFDIKNTGTLPAKVSDLKVTNNTNSDLIVEINGLNNLIGTVLGVGETTSGVINTTWNRDSTVQDPEEVSFSVEIFYSQAT